LRIEELGGEDFQFSGAVKRYPATSTTFARSDEEKMVRSRNKKQDFFIKKFLKKGFVSN